MKLTYFNGSGRAELIRLILVQGGIEFEDFRCASKDWPKMKEEGDFPFKQIPVLETDELKICQSRVIARYTARLAGLAGKTSEEEAMSDMLVVAMEDDLLEKYWQCTFFEKDPEKQAVLQKAFKEETAPKFLDNIDKLYQKSGGDYLLGNSLSYADLAYYRMISVIKAVTGDDIGSDRLKGLYQRVAALPRIVNYEKNKPESEFT